MIHPVMPDRIGRLLPLLGSDKPGELTNACRAILRDLETVGLDWHTVEIVPKAPRGFPPPTSASGQMPQFFTMAMACRDLDGGRLNDWERGFVADMCRYVRKSPSPKQVDHLSRIFVRLQRRAA